MQVCTLASGSSGNATLVCCGETRLLLDAGISARRITTALHQLGIDPASLSGVLITHEHSDHIAGIATLTKKYALPVYASEATGRQLQYRIAFLDDLFCPIAPGRGLQIGSAWVQAFATPHDAAGSMGYTVHDGQCKMALATDLGHLTQEILEAVKGTDLLIAETNHDVDWVKSGGYPYYLQQRILGDYGHLSNESGAELVRHAVEHGTQTVILGHLSSENNTPVRARQVVATRLGYAGIDPEKELHLTVAPRAEAGPMYQVQGTGDKKAFAIKGAKLC